MVCKVPPASREQVHELTHPAWDESLRSHFEDILARKELEPPSISNMADFFKSRDDGEKY